MRNLLLLVLFAVCVKSILLTREINNLLVNDLNIIATKLDDIPFTALNVQLVLLAYNCRDLLITWNIINSNQDSSSTLTTTAKSTTTKKSATSTFNDGRYYTSTTPTTPVTKLYDTADSKIFGYQIVVKEYLNLNLNNQQKEAKMYENKPPEKILNLNKTLRLYTSKYIDIKSKQNKFKLKNLLFNNIANYYICLVIYFDVIETVAFEKQCVHFNLPYSLYKNNKLCKTNATVTNTGVNDLISTSRSISSDNDDNFMTTLESTKVSTIDYEDEAESEESSTATTPTVKINPIFSLSEKKHFLNSSYSNLTSLCSQFAASKAFNECAQYSNLIIAFVICIIFLATNIFMFSIIILHMVLKCLVMRKRKKQLESRTNETLVDNRNNNHAIKSQLLSVSQVNHPQANRNRHSLATTTAYHQTHNICCMYDRCYKTDFANYSKPPLRNRYSQESHKKAKKRSKSVDFCQAFLSLFSCCTCFCPYCDQTKRESMCYNDVDEMANPKRRIQNPNEFARPGYILQMPHAPTTISSPTPTPTLSTITSASTLNSFDKIHKMQKLNLFSMNRNRQPHKPPQQQVYYRERERYLHQQQQQQQQQHKGPLNNLNVYEQDISTFDEDDTLDSEIFYHYPNKQLGPQMSSAF